MSEESVTFLLQKTGVLTRLQSERLGVTPFKFPIPPRCRKVTSSTSELDTSEITSPFHPFTSPSTSTQSVTSHLSTSPISTTISSTNPVVSFVEPCNRYVFTLDYFLFPPFLSIFFHDIITY